MSKKTINTHISALSPISNSGVETPEGVWLSALTASQNEHTGGNPVPGTGAEIVQQYQAIYKKMETILNTADLNFKDIVRTVDYVTSKALHSYPKTAKTRREVFGALLPASSTVVVNGLLDSDALIAIEVVASRRKAIRLGLGSESGACHQSSTVKIDDIVYIPAQLPVRPGTREIVGKGDVVAQARQIYENAEIILKAANLDWMDVVKTVDFFTPTALASYRGTGSVRKEYLGESYPSATGIIMESLPHPEALLQIEFIAASGKKKIINPGWSRYSRLTYVPAIRTGNLLFLSGQGPVNPETGAVEHPGDIVGQTRQIYSNIEKVLRAAGTNLDALVKTTDFITTGGLSGYADVCQMKRELFSKPHPASTTVLCEALLRPEMLIEVDALAVLS